jgi:5-(hydroxymethyl)furfural/furfural oxidase
VLPYVKKLESDVDFGKPLHGRSGPVPIQRHRPADWTRLTRTMAQMFGDMGCAMQEDQNGIWADVFPTCMCSRVAIRRASAN